MVSKRLSREAGHRRKFLVSVDETSECGRAIAYASRRAHNTSGAMVLLFVIDPSDFQGFLGVGEIMRAEATERAQMVLNQYAEELREQYGLEPELIVREGDTVEELHALIEEDQDIAILVLAASPSKEGPGPLVQSIAGRGAPFPIPVTVIPANLSDDDINAVT